MSSPETRKSDAATQPDGGKSPALGVTELPQIVRLLQIMIPALGMGVVITAGVAIGLRAAGVMKGVAETPILCWLSAGLAFVLILARASLLPKLDAALRRRAAKARTDTTPRHVEGSDEPLAPRTEAEVLRFGWMTRTIVGVAMVEAYGLTGGIGYLIEGNWLGLAVAGTSLLGVLMQIPSLSLAEEWLDNQKRLMAEEFTADGKPR